LIFYQSKTTRITKLLCTLQKPDNIKVVGYFQKNDHCILLKISRNGFVLLLCRQPMILIPFEQSVKWSALITGEETPDSAFTQLENKPRTF
jgi:isochorismate synthase